MTIENDSLKKFTEEKVNHFDSLKTKINNYSKLVLGYGLLTGRIAFVTIGLSLLTVFSAAETKELVRLAFTKKTNNTK